MQSKVKDAFFGVAVGDAFGFPYQFLKRDTYKVAMKMRPSDRLLPAGSWSDDTAMTLATMDSITTCEGVDIEDMMLAFSLWLQEGDFTPFGWAFDVGGGTLKSIHRYISGIGVDECGLRDFNCNGNGSLMRILPLAFVDCTLDDIAAVSSLTHAHDYSVHACQIQVAVAKRLLNGEGIAQALRNVMCSEPYCNYKEYSRLLNIGTLKRNEIQSSGFVVDTLEAAMWCLLKTRSYRECILTAARLGLDTDTIGAVAGGLAGILYGVGGLYGIPKAWIRSLQAPELLNSIINDFDEFVQ